MQSLPQPIQLRFNEVGGFNPMHVERNIGRVFKAAGNLAVIGMRIASPPLEPSGLS
jgi:hypothetical protein